MGLIDTYQLATGGQNLIDTYTRASNGVLIRIFIEDVIIPTSYMPGGGSSTTPRSLPTKEEIKKKITVIATVEGREYTETFVIDDIPNLKVENVDVQVNMENSKPKISIKIIR